ncbi:CPBP family intramembrane metalloprotease [candidate division KSB1 bacterium]|nr:MAG: CPBP family intramembrane metalloprotease [candidate division KSB1 bacterium]
MQIRLVKTIFYKELRDVLRDRRTLFMMIVLPILLYPLLILGFGSFAASQAMKLAKKQTKVAVIGMHAGGTLTVMLDSLSGMSIVDTANWRSRIIDGTLDAAVIIPSGFIDSLAEGRTLEIGLYHNSSREVSGHVRDRIERTATIFRDQIVARRLTALGADTSVLRPFRVHSENLATQEQRQGDLLGKMLGYLVIMMMIMGAFYAALDLTAGEKERGTLETLLVSPASRADIVLGKFLTVAVISVVTAFLNLLSMGGTFAYGMALLGRVTSKALPAMAISPVSLLLSLLLILPLVVLFSSVCIAVAVNARNYKEGQSLLTPVYLAAIMPAMISLVPGTEMTPLMALVPIANVSLLIKEFLMGNYLWLQMFIAFASTSVLAAAALWWATEQFKNEAVLFRHAEDLRWSPLQWLRKLRVVRQGLNLSFPSPASGLIVLTAAIILMLTVATPSGNRSIELTILLGQFAIVLPPLLTLQRGKYDIRQALKLTLPRFAAWPATVVLMIGGWLLAVELASLQNLLTPFPEEFVRKFEQFFADLNRLPLGRSLLLVAVLPGVCEEILFRGFLLQSFLPKLGKTGSVIAVGLAFGLMHMDVYKFFSAAFLGILLGIIVLRTGSLFPAILAHMLNNSFSFLVQKYQDYLPGVAWLDEKAAVLLPWHIVLIAAGFVAAGLFWLKRIETEG